MNTASTGYDAERRRRQLIRLGESEEKSPIDGRMFKYHGDETSPPPLSFATQFATSLPYRPGMPGPSFSWSAFADNPLDAVEIIQSDRMLSLVIEQLDESLVVSTFVESLEASLLRFLIAGTLHNLSILKYAILLISTLFYISYFYLCTIPTVIHSFFIIVENHLMERNFISENTFYLFVKSLTIISSTVFVSLNVLNCPF